MCKEELNQVDKIEEVESQEQEYFTQDEVYDIIEQVTPKIEINTDEVQGLKLNEDEFSNGLKSVSFLCGQYSALRSVGIDSSSAIDIIVNERNIEFNKELNSQTCDNNKEVAKIQQAIADQNQV